MRPKQIILLEDERDIERSFDLANGIIIDVREEEEFQRKHIPGSNHVDLMSENFGEFFADIEKMASILIYCENGSRSKLAVRILQEMGFVNIFHLVYGLVNYRGELVARVE